MIRDYIKRRIINIFKGGRLKTPVTTIIETLKAYEILPEHQVTGLDLFGGNGLWNTYDYACLCSYLEVWEIDRMNAKLAKRFLPNADVFQGDSITAVNERKLKRENYNFIFIDNPVGGYYGSDYCEHFDLFPGLIHYFNSHTILIFNLVLDTEEIGKMYIKDEGSYTRWIKRRELFYGIKGVIKPSLNELIHVYEDTFRSHEILPDFSFYVPRDHHVGFLVFSLERSA